MPDFFTTSTGHEIAYHRHDGEGVGVVFLGGFMSDMEGSKAIAFEEWTLAQGRPYLRFDYSGHGQSSGQFEDGTIGAWAQDAREAIEALTDGPQLLVGSSMGGWISLLIARDTPEKVAGLVTIAAAPDFTEDGFWADFTEVQKREVMEEGVTLVPSDYGSPYPITRALIEDGRNHLVLREPLSLPMPVRMIQGTEDTAVSRDWALRLLDHIEADDIALQFVKGGDHSFSAPENLMLTKRLIAELLERA